MSSILVQDKKKYKKLKFSAMDDQKLKDLIKLYGDQDWNFIASQMKDRNSRQCKERWEYYLSPTVNNGPWTQEEDDLLIEKFNELGSKWKEIAKFFKFRTNTNVKNRWLLKKRIEEKERNIPKENIVDQLFKDVDFSNNSLSEIEFFSLDFSQFSIFHNTTF